MFLARNFDCEQTWSGRGFHPLFRFATSFTAEFMGGVRLDALVHVHGDVIGIIPG